MTRLWRQLCMQRQGFNAAERATKAANKEGQCLTGYTSTCGANGSSLTVACFPNSAQCPVASIGLQLSPFVVTKSRDIGVVRAGACFCIAACMHACMCVCVCVCVCVREREKR